MEGFGYIEKSLFIKIECSYSIYKWRCNEINIKMKHYYFSY